jgi:hypothetical protein
MAVQKLLEQSKSERESGRYVFSIRKMFEGVIATANIKAVSKASAR